MHRHIPPFSAQLTAQANITSNLRQSLANSGNHRRQTGKLQQTRTNTSECGQTLLILPFQGGKTPWTPLYYIPPSFHKPICWNLVVFAMFASFFRSLPVSSGVFRCLLVFSGVFRCLLGSAGNCRCLPLIASVCGCLPVVLA